MKAVTKQQELVAAYWNARPCDSDRSARPKGTRDYFAEVEADRYRYQPHVPRVLAWLDWRGKTVLEIGTGVGTDARRLSAYGARYYGINVDQGSSDLTASALRAFDLAGEVSTGSATSLPYADGMFDIVYTFGVLHHIPDVKRALSEIRRVLKPRGEILLMVYNRSSINYYVEIMFLRRLLRHCLRIPGIVSLLAAFGLPADKLARHRELARQPMSRDEWLSRNTDGPDNPYSCVYGRREIEDALEGFEVLRNEVFFFDWRHWGRIGALLPRPIIEAIGRRYGWHRIVHARKQDRG